MFVFTVKTWHFTMEPSFSDKKGSQGGRSANCSYSSVHWRLAVKAPETPLTPMIKRWLMFLSV